jgi:hypothetical protein
MVSSDDDCLSDTVYGSEGSFYFARLYSISADLDLSVVATAELQSAISAPKAQVTGAIHASAAILAERIANEARRGKLR